MKKIYPLGRELTGSGITINTSDGYSLADFQKLAKEENLDIVKVLSFGKTLVGQLVSFLDYKSKQISLKLSALFFPIFFPLIAAELFLFETRRPSNYVIKAQKK